MFSLESCSLPCQLPHPDDAEQKQVSLEDPSLEINQDALKYNEETDFIGSGGYGEVYKATLKRNEEEQTVAVKVFKSFKRRRAKKECDDFKKKASILLRIAPHRFIINLIGRCTNVGHYALITAFVNGGDLHDLLSSDDAAIQRMEVRISIAKQIAIGMVHLHYNRPPIIHYDLKAVNILVEKKGNDFICKICDFGLSKIADGSAVTSDQAPGSTPKGTVAYIAPERYRAEFHEGGSRRVKIEEARKSDVYSYGVLLWEIRERSPPYKGLPKYAIHLKAEQGARLPKGQAASQAPPHYNSLLCFDMILAFSLGAAVNFEFYKNRLAVCIASINGASRFAYAHCSFT
ncbi:probable serine/threonine-protein kinase DDB_G0271682 [Oscarella lobularis]|uniref:probable serine/threonine-protein kinase DDB_G0271682 n=1 Tax=Oscarella lobularis TaxID=121494 RepID=UPI0033143B2C